MGVPAANLSTVNADYDLRHVETAREKAAIGRAAAELVKPGSSVFLTPGTTIDALAKAIAERAPSGLRIVTNSTTAASVLERCPGIAIQITGGLWMGHNRAVAGAAAVAIVESYRCDLHMMSIGGIHSNGNLLEYKDDETIVRAPCSATRGAAYCLSTTRSLRASQPAGWPISAMSILL